MLKVQITKRGIDAKALSMGKVEISAGSVCPAIYFNDTGYKQRFQKI